MKVISLHDKNVWIGENARDNWVILDDVKDTYWFFHLSSLPSCYVVYTDESDLSDDVMDELARICRDNTKYKNWKNIKVDCTRCGNVEKGDVIGECKYVSKKKVKVLKI